MTISKTKCPAVGSVTLETPDFYTAYLCMPGRSQVRPAARPAQTPEVRQRPDRERSKTKEELSISVA